MRAEEVGWWEGDETPSNAATLSVSEANKPASVASIKLARCSNKLGVEKKKSSQTSK